MKLNNYLKGFNDYSTSQSINEMASSLSKLGVPKDLMQFIHKLSGKITHSKQAQKQWNPATGKMDTEFHTREAPHASKKGPWPGTEDVPLAHDVEVIGTKTGRKNIQHYLEQIISKIKDTDTRLILATPSIDGLHYITRKLGKLGPAGRIEKFGEDDLEIARAAGHSEKTGMYLRHVAIDPDSGEAIADWWGTIGQIIQAGHIAEDSILYILETEDKVRASRKTRSDIRTVNPEAFIEYFVENFEKIAGPMLTKSGDRARSEYAKTMSEISPDDITTEYGYLRVNNKEAKKKIQDLIGLINSSKFDADTLLPRLNTFLELAMKDGEYEAAERHTDTADLTDMVKKHTQPVVASMFLQYLVLGRVAKNFYTDNPFVELGLDDLF
jgi:hypothetical protein